MATKKPSFRNGKPLFKNGKSCFGCCTPGMQCPCVWAREPYQIRVVVSGMEDQYWTRTEGDIKYERWIEGFSGFNGTYLTGCTERNDFFEVCHTGARLFTSEWGVDRYKETRISTGATIRETHIDRTYTLFVEGFYIAAPGSRIPPGYLDQTWQIRNGFLRRTEFAYLFGCETTSVTLANDGKWGSFGSVEAFIEDL